jgi:hypothetical protein
MIELLAIPAWNAPARSVDDWVAALVAEGLDAVITRDDDETWLEVARLRMRGFVEHEGSRLEAINFELEGPDADQATVLLARAARTLDWEVHADDENDDLDED